MKGIFLIAFFSILSLNLVAQNRTVSSEEIKTYFQERDFEKGELTIYRDPRLETLIHRHIEFNKEQKGIPGFRIQIFFGSGRTSRDNANEAKAKFLSYFFDKEAYIKYQTPFYKVRIGDFRTKLEALKMFKRVLRKFPNAYIVPDVINFPDLD
jgi:hypothetical protein